MKELKVFAQFATMPHNLVYVAFFFVLPKRQFQYPLNYTEPRPNYWYYTISIFQFPPRNTKCSRKAARRVLWRHSAYSSWRGGPVSAVTTGTQSCGLIRKYEVARITWARELQSERKGMRSILNEIDMNKHDAFQDHRPIAVNVQTLTDYHSDMDHMKSYSSV